MPSHMAITHGYPFGMLMHDRGLNCRLMPVAEQTNLRAEKARPGIFLPAIPAHVRNRSTLNPSRLHD
ncbi:MAG: hypothetical protein Q8J78_07455 [Moraxellaceae bacterium]|nr:hypothetical protein [Moraxellaceae bacterium]